MSGRVVVADMPSPLLVSRKSGAIVAWGERRMQHSQYNSWLQRHKIGCDWDDLNFSKLFGNFALRTGNSFAIVNLEELYEAMSPPEL